VNPNRPWADLSDGARRSGLLTLAAVLVLVVGFGWSALRSRAERAGEERAFAIEAGRLTIPELAAPVEILRDGRGIPHIEAMVERDAWLAVGLVHAQDRLAQMLWLRALARGRVCEWVGERGLPADRLARTLGIGLRSDREAERLPPDVRDVLEAYAEGINSRIARIRAGAAAPPLALEVAPGDIADWTPADSIAVVKLVAWSTGNRIETGLVLDDLIERLGSQLARPFRPTGVGVQGVEIPSDLSVEEIVGHASTQTRNEAPIAGADLVRATALGGGSAWVLSGRHTESGAPMLVADLHLPTTSPPLLHQVQVRGGDLDLAGAMIPGAPVIWAGRNLHVAWAAIPSHAVTVDLYKESIRADEDLYRNGSRWSALDVRNEIIRIRTGPGVFREHELVVRETRHGPLINELLRPIRGTVAAGRGALLRRRFEAALEAEVPGNAGLGAAYPDAGSADVVTGSDREGERPSRTPGAITSSARAREAASRRRREPLSLAWTGALPGNGIESLLAVARAHDADALLSALARHHEPVVTVVYADAKGAAGKQLAGWLPQRALPTSLVPVPGRLRLFDWRHPIDFSALPAIRFDASSSTVGRQGRSWVAVADGSADEGLTTAGIEWMWHTGERQRRLESRLEVLTTGRVRGARSARVGGRAPKVDLRAAADVQIDVGGAAGVEVVPALLRLARRSGPLRPEAEEIAELLRRWDGSAAPGSHGAVVYQVLSEHLIELLFREPFGASLYDRYLALPGVRPRSVVARLIVSADRSRDRGGWTDVDRVSSAIRDALRGTWVSLSYRLGPARTGWTWGGLHSLGFEPFVGIPGGRKSVRAIDRFGVGGDESTLATTEFDRRRDYDVVRAATFRIAVDLAAPDRVLSVLAPGQSEHIGHPHRSDEVDRWRQGRSGLLLTSRLHVEEESGARLLLEPKS
jgi:penicillin amidase